MGMIANYQLINDIQLQKLKSMIAKSTDDYFEIVEEWNEESEHLLDIDKMWDVLHFVLTGTGSENPPIGSPLSEAVLGEVSLETDEFMAYLSADRVCAVLEALEVFDIELALEKFTMEDGRKAKLYPNIWAYQEEEEEIKEEILHYFNAMKVFYQNTLQKGANVLVTIY